jgi:predicted permease
MKNLAQDLRFALRQLRKSPGFTLTAVLTLALGIGAATAIFSVVDGVLLQPLAYPDSGRLVVVWERVRLLEKLFPYTGANPRHARIWQDQSTAFSALTLLQQNSAGITLGNHLGNDHPRFVGRLIAQPNLLEVLGIQPALGRNFLPEEGVKGHENVVLISWNLWQSLFHGDPEVIGRWLKLAGTPRQVVGVLPKDFYFPKPNELAAAPEAHQMPDTEIVSPLAIDTNNFGWNSDYGNYVALGRLKPQVTVAAAQAELDTLAKNIARQIPPDQLDGDPAGALATYVQPLKEVIVGRTTRSVWLLFAAVLSVLLIACVNLANAQLARFVARDREAALRSALGASAWSLLQSAVAEASILSLAGGLLGVALANLAVRHFARFAQFAIPRSEAVALNTNVLALSVVLTVGATFLCGALPALRFLRIRPQQALQTAGRSSASGASRTSHLLRRWLIGGQVFACTTLLLLAALFARSLLHLLTSDKGFSSSHVVVASVTFSGTASTDSERARFDDGVLDQLRSLPGVQSAALVSAILLDGESWIDGVVRTDQTSHQATQANYRWISPDYFATLHQHLLHGRDLEARDRTLKSALISEATAKAVWPNLDPIGRQFSRNETTYTVVGIVADARNNSLREAPVNVVYLPYWDNPPYASFFLVRSAQSFPDTALLASSVRKAIWKVNPDATIAAIRSLDAKIGDSLAPERIETTLLAAFGAAAFLLALLGIYATLSYSVESRTPEIGIRIALGATRKNVYFVTLQEAVAPVALGLGLGWIASIGIGKAVAALLYGTAPTDPAAALAILCVFAFAAFAATFLPCRRAARIDPMAALRSE